MITPDLRNPIDQLPYLNMPNDEFEAVANSFGYECEMLTEATGYIITMQARQRHELVVSTKDGRVVRII